MRIVQDIVKHPDNLVRVELRVLAHSRNQPRQDQMLRERIGIVEVSPHESLIYHDGQRRANDVAFIQKPAAHQTNAEGAKIARRNCLIVSRGEM